MKRIFFMIFSLIILINYGAANEKDEKNIILDIGECILNISPTTQVGISSDCDATFIDLKTSDVYTVGWRKDVLNFWKKDLHKQNIQIKQNKHLTIIDYQDKIIVIGRNFFIHFFKSNKNVQKYILSCNNTWREDMTQIDVETMINEFHISEKEIKILEDISQKFYYHSD